MNYHKRDESEGSGSEGPDSEKCHHDHFPKETIQQKLGDKDVKTCCKDYGYIFKDACIWPVSWSNVLCRNFFGERFDQFLTQKNDFESMNLRCSRRLFIKANQRMKVVENYRMSHRYRANFEYINKYGSGNLIT